MAYGLKAGQQYTVSCCFDRLVDWGRLFPSFFFVWEPLFDNQKKYEKVPNIKKITILFTDFENVLLDAKLKLHFICNTQVLFVC